MTGICLINGWGKDTHTQPERRSCDHGGGHERDRTTGENNPVKCTRSTRKDQEGSSTHHLQRAPSKAGTWHGPLFHSFKRMNVCGLWSFLVAVLGNECTYFLAWLCPQIIVRCLLCFSFVFCFQPPRNPTQFLRIYLF